MRVLMTGGGTAGHVNPAIAIANTIMEKEPDSVIEFVSSNLKYDKARELVPRHGYKLHGVDICGRYQIWNPKNIKTAYYMVKSASQAKKIIRDFAPDVIIGTGGFACYPLLNAGASMGIPTLLHESNAIPGRAVKKLSGKVDCIMTNFEVAREALSGTKRAIRVGNPMIIKKQATEEVAPEIPRQVLCVGGSGGAEEFNNGVVKTIAAIADEYPNTVFYHASGKRDFDRMTGDYERLGLKDKKNVVLVDYIYDMDNQMKNSDVIISRAGAMTLSELALLGKAAILVPSPNVICNHQYKNAKPIADADACLLVEEKDFSSGKLTDAARKLLSDSEKRIRMGKNVKSFAVEDANDVIFDIIKEYVKKN